MSILRILLGLILVRSLFGEPLPPVNAVYESASAAALGEELVVSTGLVARRWRWTGKGLSTCSVRDLRTEKEWVKLERDDRAADWEAKRLIGDADGEVLSLTAAPSSDGEFTSQHLRVRADIAYPTKGIVLRYEIWAYPGSEGLRTQLWIRRDDGEGLLEDLSSGNAPSFEVVAGRPFTASSALEIVDEWHASSLQSKKQVKVRLQGLVPNTSYHMGVSWWDFGNGGRTQSLRATSIDGEAQETLIPATLLPGWKEDKEQPKSSVVPFSAEVNIDGTVSLLVDNHQGPNAVVGELWLYGQGPVANLVVDPKRRKELEAMAPKGTQLIAYFDAGQKLRSEAEISENRSDFLPIQGQQLRAIGYFNDTQNRHRPDTHLVREEAVESGRISWASILCLEDIDGGFAVVKESHKCVNQSGVQTGAFLADESGVAVTGWGLTDAEVSSDFRWCWATWMVLYPEANSDSRELALKRFDRTRYPTRIERDLYLKANTWGSGINQPASFARAKESEVLAEIDSVADLGLDALQIDDGWQVGRMKNKSKALREWQVRPDWYRDGWENVVAKAQEREVELGIWFAARAPVEDLKASFDQAGFTTYKLDFANLGNYSGVESYLAKGRALVSYSEHRAKVNWDVTENASRFGYFWARECGSIWLANRKPMAPESVVPRPWLMLRESWELARYLNSNRFELPIQNFRMVNQEVSDAHLHSDSYSVALGLSGIPVFFQTTRLLEADQREEIKELLKAYREVRADLFESFVFPIGSEPDNASWAGFQWVSSDADTGYLLIFRERLNQSSSQKIELRFLKPGTNLVTKDLRKGGATTMVLDEESSGEFAIPNAGDILFLRYEKS